jgi:hypothetical protein
MKREEEQNKGQRKERNKNKLRKGDTLMEYYYKSFVILLSAMLIHPVCFVLCF